MLRVVYIIAFVTGSVLATDPSIAPNALLLPPPPDEPSSINAYIDKHGMIIYEMFTRAKLARANMDPVPTTVVTSMVNALARHVTSQKLTAQVYFMKQLYERRFSGNEMHTKSSRQQFDGVMKNN